MRHIFMQPPAKIPRDDEFKFRDRANVLVEKWHTLINASKEPSTTTTTITVAPGVDGAPATATATTTGAEPSVAVTTAVDGTVTASVVTENGAEPVKENGDVAMEDNALKLAINGDASMAEVNGEAEKTEKAAVDGDVVMGTA